MYEEFFTSQQLLPKSFFKPSTKPIDMLKSNPKVGDENINRASYSSKSSQNTTSTKAKLFKYCNKSNRNHT